jgi:hypothetical protein
MTNSRDQGIDRLITNNLHRLSKYGALTARPGYEIAGHQLTGRRAIVATVRAKKPLASLTRGQALPNNIGGVPVDVREANSYQRLRTIDPLAAEVIQTYRRLEYADTTWRLERGLPSGKLLKSARSEAQERLKAQIKAQPPARAELNDEEGPRQNSEEWRSRGGEDDDPASVRIGGRRARRRQKGAVIVEEGCFF